MAYQNFFARTEKPGRIIPAQASGKTLENEFRMRNDGESFQVVHCLGIVDEVNKTVTTYVRVYDPVTGKLVFDRLFTCPR